MLKKGFIWRFFLGRGGEEGGGGGGGCYYKYCMLEVYLCNMNTFLWEGGGNMYPAPSPPSSLFYGNWRHIGMVSLLAGWQMELTPVAGWTDNACSSV